MKVFYSEPAELRTPFAQLAGTLFLSGQALVFRTYPRYFLIIVEAKTSIAYLRLFVNVWGRGTNQGSFRMASGSWFSTRQLGVFSEARSGSHLVHYLLFCQQKGMRLRDR